MHHDVVIHSLLFIKLTQKSALRCCDSLFYIDFMNKSELQHRNALFYIKFIIKIVHYTIYI